MTPMLALLAFTSTLAPLHAQDVRPQLELEALDGTVRRLPLAGLELADPRTEGAWILRPVDLGDEAADAAGREPARGGESSALVSLAGGERLSGRVDGGEGETLFLELVGDVRLPLRIDHLASVVFPERIPLGFGQDLVAAAEGDRIYRVSGASLDRIDGTVEDFTAEGVRFESLLGSRVFPWEELAALFVEVLGSEPAPAAQGTPIVVDLVDLSRVRGQLVKLDATGCRMSVPGGGEIQVPWTQIEELLVEDGSLHFLSDLAPTGEEGHGTPFGDELGMRWPHRIDRSVVGGALRAGGSTFARGIGMHAPSRVRWDLGGAWQSLRGKVAIDDSVLQNAEGARGAVVFRVHADGALLWESGVIRGGDAPLPLPRLSLAGVRELVLEADPEGDFAGDRANWLHLVLAR